MKKSKRFYNLQSVPYIVPPPFTNCLGIVLVWVAETMGLMIWISWESSFCFILWCYCMPVVVYEGQDLNWLEIQVCINLLNFTDHPLKHYTTFNILKCYIEVFLNFLMKLYYFLSFILTWIPLFCLMCARIWATNLPYVNLSHSLSIYVLSIIWPALG